MTMNVKESIKKLKKDRNYFGYATEMENDHRQEEWYNQRKETGFDDTETWSLKTTIAKFALPRLKWFKERHFDNPCDITFERWNEILDNMIFSFEYYAKDEWELISDEEFKRVEEGMKLFGEYYGDLWW